MLDANDIIAQVSADMSTDELLRRYHEHPTREARMDIAARFREERAAWKAKKAKREEEKEQEDDD